MSQLIQSEPTRSSKQTLLDAEGKWIESLRDEWTPFSVTTVFKSSGVVPRKEHWLDEYKHKVVWKVNKRLSRRASELIPIHEIGCYYEFGESSLMKSFADKRQPHHVHAMLLIPKNLTNRVWDEEGQELNSRLEQDFKSIRTVSSVLMEPVRTGESTNWLVYSAKGKPFNVH